MKAWRRITAIVLAAALAVSPAIACADFCPQSPTDGPAEASPPSNPLPMNAAAMPEDCADAMNVSSGAGSQSHDPDCQGCTDCPVIASVKAPVLASVGALTIDAPAVITIDLMVSSIIDAVLPARQRLTPPANGPPVAATPVILKDLLLI